MGSHNGLAVLRWQFGAALPCRHAVSLPASTRPGIQAWRAFQPQCTASTLTPIPLSRHHCGASAGRAAGHRLPGHECEREPVRLHYAGSLCGCITPPLLLPPPPPLLCCTLAPAAPAAAVPLWRVALVDGTRCGTAARRMHALPTVRRAPVGLRAGAGCSCWRGSPACCWG